MNTGLKRSHWILLATLAVSFYNLGVIWLMQMHIYQSFYLIGTNEWPAFFSHHWRTVQLFVLPPASLALVGAVLLVRYRPDGVPKGGTWFGLALQLVVFALTGVIWAPLQAQLSRGNDPELVSQLLRSHWIRVAIVTTYAVLLFWMTVRSVAYERSKAVA